MNLALKFLAIPLASAAIAAFCAWISSVIIEISVPQMLALCSALFCIVMVMINHAMLLWDKHQTGKKIAAIFDLEETILRRIKNLENNQVNTNAGETVISRLNILEAAESRRQAKAAIDQKEPTVLHDSKNVVQFQSGPRTQSEPQTQTGTQVLGSKENPNKKTKTGEPPFSRKSQIIALFASNQYVLKLQPIVNLLSRETVAVEAFGGFETENGWIAGNSILEALSSEQCSKMDQNAFISLAKVVRKMERDGQLLPIHYRLLDPGFADPLAWQTISNLLRADTRLASSIVPVISMRDWIEGSKNDLSKFLELKEFGLKPCMADCIDDVELSSIVQKKRFTHFKVNMAEIARFTANEGELVGDVILPMFSDEAIVPIINGVENAHHAATLIDLNMSVAQGDYFSPPRSITLSPDTAIATNLDFIPLR